MHNVYFYVIMNDIMSFMMSFEILYTILNIKDLVNIYAMPQLTGFLLIVSRTH